MSLKLDNLITLFDYLSEHQWRSAEQVARRLEVDRRTVFRYMDEVELAFSPVPVIERGREGYRLCRNDFLDVLQSREDYAGVAALVASPLGELASGGKPLPDRLLRQARELVETRASLEPKLLRQIFEAMRSGVFLELSYTAKDEPRPHRVVPIKFALRSAIPYLVAFDEGYGHLIVLAADKIGRAAKSRKFLTPDELGSLRAYVNSAWGIMVRHKERLVTELSFEASRSAAAFFEKAPLHPSQRCERDGERIAFTLKVHNEGEFFRHILRFGRGARVVAPESAVAEARAFLASMGEFYGSAGTVEA